MNKQEKDKTIQAVAVLEATREVAEWPGYGLAETMLLRLGRSARYQGVAAEAQQENQDLSIQVQNSYSF